MIFTSFIFLYILNRIDFGVSFVLNPHRHLAHHNQDFRSRTEHILTATAGNIFEFKMTDCFIPSYQSYSWHDY
jgi:hypothetical protein